MLVVKLSSNLDTMLGLSVIDGVRAVCNLDFNGFASAWKDRSALYVVAVVQVKFRRGAGGGNLKGVFFIKAAKIVFVFVLSFGFDDIILAGRKFWQRHIVRLRGHGSAYSADWLAQRVCNVKAFVLAGHIDLS